MSSGAIAWCRSPMAVPTPMSPVEFDLVERRWVESGFYRPEAKGDLGWIDRDTVYAYTAFGEGGHGGAADSRQRVHMQALTFTFLCETLLA